MANIKAVLRAPKLGLLQSLVAPGGGRSRGNPTRGGKVGRLSQSSTEWRGAPGLTVLVLQVDLGLVLEKELGCVGLALSW